MEVPAYAQEVLRGNVPAVGKPVAHNFSLGKAEMWEGTEVGCGNEGEELQGLYD